ncbi:hypothetical protein KCV07_g9487, partial [Aureobasidium melanogenum]
MSSSTKDSQSSKSVAVNIISASASSQGSSAVYTPPILKLPVELLRMIFSHCNKDNDFQDTKPHVRLVCKDLEPVIAHMLAREWSGRLDLQINKRSMEGLAQIRPIFASNLKAIRLCTQRMDKVGKIDSSDATIKDRVGKLRESTPKGKDWSDEDYEQKLAGMRDDVTSHNQDAEEQQEQFTTGGLQKSLLRALQTLVACHDNSVTLGTYDYLNVRAVWSSKTRLRGFGFEDVRIINDASSTFQILASAVRMSSYPVKTIDIRLFDGSCNIESTDIFWTQLPSFTELSVRQLPSFSDFFPKSSEPKFSVIQSDGWHLEMAVHRFFHCWTWGSWSHFDKANYEALYDYVRSKEFKTVVLKSVQGPEIFLESDLNLRANCLERLELLTVFIECIEDDTAMQAGPLKFLTYLQSLVRLQTLILQDVSVPDTPYCIQKERVEWNGYAEIQAGLDDLIAKAKAHYS